MIKKSVKRKEKPSVDLKYKIGKKITGNSVGDETNSKIAKKTGGFHWEKIRKEHVVCYDLFIYPPKKDMGFPVIHCTTKKKTSLRILFSIKFHCNSYHMLLLIKTN